MSSSTATAPKRENLLLNLVFNVGLPTAILTWLSAPKYLGPKAGLVVALLFPVGYGIYDFIARRRCNFISILGFASVLLSGGLGLMKLDAFWFAVKEAAIPGIIGLVVLASSLARTPLVNELLYNPQVIDIAKVDAALVATNNTEAFKRLLRKATGLLSISFFISSALNYGLARYLLTSEPGSEAFNKELGRMNLWSWPVIVLPSMVMMMLVLMQLLKGIRLLTGLTMDDVFHAPPDKTKADATEPNAAANPSSDADKS